MKVRFTLFALLILSSPLSQAQVDPCSLVRCSADTPVCIANDQGQAQCVAQTPAPEPSMLPLLLAGGAALLLARLVRHRRR